MAWYDFISKGLSDHFFHPRRKRPSSAAITSVSFSCPHHFAAHPPKPHTFPSRVRRAHPLVIAPLAAFTIAVTRARTYIHAPSHASCSIWRGLLTAIATAIALPGSSGIPICHRAVRKDEGGQGGNHGG